MLDGVGLIHLNGRVYDPTVGRFLSVDPLVRDAAASQSWNGYGYVEGRVLSATDPSGWQTVDCPQCVRYRADPPRSAMEVVVVTARRWDPLSINLDRLGLNRPRLFGRLHSLRGWSNGNTDEVFSGSSGACGSAGAREPA